MPPPAPKEEPEDESWLATYADAITLLMAFFVLLVAVSKVDLALYEEVAEGINEKVNKKERKAPVQELKEETTEIVQELTDGKVLKVGVDDSGIVLEFDSETFFRPGTAQLIEEAYPVISSLAELVNSPQYLVFNMDVEGHTDDDPISTIQFPSNWVLGAARAASVLQVLNEYGVEIKRMRVLSYASTRPKVPNRLDDGTPLPENKAQNRRVVLRIHQKPFEYSPPKYVPTTSIARDYDPEADAGRSNEAQQVQPAQTPAPTDQQGQPQQAPAPVQNQ
ncbi:flagellar motor protein MotB [Terasakiella sp. A23]|uniref:OmpA/MotB family protein n=1 Tax=Terasakiella sp. FCG-A23 TaxID=3080561 RepID=UPI00295365F3|nr:flagellar motor protein MotB [Terasakiella sp. A23]MDV7338739.1 flagellar motor protein MotB [Terasakiella sp. A23]